MHALAHCMDSCKVNIFSKLDLDADNNDDDAVEKGYEYIKGISSIQDSDISSHPVRVCFWKSRLCQPARSDPHQKRKGENTRLSAIVLLLLIR